MKIFHELFQSFRVAVPSNDSVEPVHHNHEDPRKSRWFSVVLIRRNITFLLAFVFIIKVVKMSLWINYVRLGIQKSKHQNRNSAIVFSVSFLYLESIFLIVIQKISCILFYAKFNFTCNKILQLILAWNINEMVSIYFEF